MASPTWWTWVWVNTRSCWWTGRPGMLRFMGSQRVGHNWSDLPAAAAAINNKSVTKTNILIYRFSTRYIKHVTLRCQLGNSLGSVFQSQDHILFSRLWTVPSGLVRSVSCLIASSLSIIINLFCGPCGGLFLFYSSCLLQDTIMLLFSRTKFSEIERKNNKKEFSS